MVDELVDIFDENNNSLNKTALKSVSHTNGLWHRVVHAWIYNSKYKLLLQLRSKNKDLFPNMYDVSVGGHISAGEGPLNSVIRELSEELGIKAGEDDLIYYDCFKHQAKYKDIIHNQYCYTYFLKKDLDLTSLVLQASEVESAKFMTINELFFELTARPERFVPHGSYWEQVIDFIKILKRRSLTSE